MKNKGFTLVELAAVVSILGVLIILTTPVIMDAINSARRNVNKYQKDELIDAAKMYVQALDDGNDEYIFNEVEDKTINNHLYHKGDVMKPYDFKTYVIQNDGITIPIKDLIAKEYFNKECDYQNSPSKCVFKESCQIKVNIDNRLVEENQFYVTIGYQAKLLNDCE